MTLHLKNPQYLAFLFQFQEREREISSTCLLESWNNRTSLQSLSSTYSNAILKVARRNKNARDLNYLSLPTPSWFSNIGITRKDESFFLLMPLQQITPLPVTLLHDSPFKKHLQTICIKENYIKNIPKSITNHDTFY